MLVSSSAADVRRGFEMGTAEAARAAALFRGSVQRYVAQDTGTLIRAGCSVVVSTLSDPAALLAASRAVAEHGVILLNAGAEADSLRRSACGEYSFHVIPSSAMRRHAAGTGVVRLSEWDGRLTRFGAAQLNDRFRHRYGAEMTEGAWCGWMAAKIAWESAVRAASTSGADIRTHLLRPATRFDGHKGRAMRFDAIDRQLYQPLYQPGDLREVSVAPRIPAHGRQLCGR